MAGRILIIVDGPAALTYGTPMVTALRQRKYTVQVAPTAYPGPSATAFVSELAWTTLSGHPCKTIETLDAEAFRQQDLILLAPVSHQVLDIFLRGKALEYLQAAGKPVLAAVPRLSSDPQEDPTEFLAKMPPRSILLQGDTLLDLGAMGTLKAPSLEALLLTVDSILSKNDLAGKRVLITAGPTAEDIDPVRFLTNRSSGKMGIALATAAALRGAEVQLVHGPIQTTVPALTNLHAVPVRSAEEMHHAVLECWTNLDIAILAAAVADFRPDHYAPQKIKKVDGQALILNLRRTPDILAELGTFETRPFLVGFAAESDDVEVNALLKLRKKHCDLICANDIRKPGCGFAVDTNQITLYSPEEAPLHLPLKPKRELADDILNEIVRRMK